MSDVKAEPRIDVSPAAALLRLAQGYRISQMIYVATQLGVADLLAEGAKSSEDLARGTGTHQPSLYRLLRGLSAAGVLDEVEADRFTLAPLGACLRADAPDSVRDGVLMWDSGDFWQTWGDLLHCVRTGESATSHLYGTPNSFAYYAQHPEMNALMNAGFAAGARQISRAVVASYDFSGSGTIVDVGGGVGQLLAMILRANPSARGVLFDQPHVVAQAGPVLDREGVADRCVVVSGDIFAEVPSGGDTYILSRVIHDWDDAHALAILRTCRRAMRPDATLALVEMVLPNRIERSATAEEQTLGDLNMLVRTGGRERTQDEFRSLLDSAGFELSGVTPTTAAQSVLTGKCSDVERKVKSGQ